MSVRGDLYLGIAGSEVLLSPFGRQFSVNATEANRQRRTLDGTMKKDLIYKKHRFSLNYSIITGAALQQYITLYNLDQELNFIMYEDDSTPQNFTVFMSPIDRKRVVLIDDGLFSSVNVALDEV